VENVADGRRYASGVVHAPGGGVSALTFGNGLALAQTWNLRGEPVSVASGPVSLSYGTSPAGDVAGISDGTASRTFGYDFLDRLVGSPGWLAYGYDGNGNRTSETVEGTGLSYAYSTDRVTKSTRAGTTSTRHIFAHDYQANVSAIVAYAPNGVTEGRLCLRHDALGRLALVGVASSSLYIGLDSFGCLRDSNVSQVLARFRYDGRNRRIARWTAAENRWTYVVSDPAGNPLSELALVNGAWTRVRDYVWLYGRPLAQIEYPGPAGSTEGYVYYFHVDAIGLPRALTNQTGQTVWSASARPYGDLVETATPDPVSGRTVVTNLRLPGQYDERLFASLGLQGPYYNWNRWYLPGVGRYLELDVLALEGKMNGDHAPDWYTYANSNPLTFIDPDGTMGQAIRDPGQCMKELRCPATITCGGETLNLVSCGYGSCSICPLENLFASAWCAYATPPGRCPEKTGGLFKPKLGRGPITGKWIGPICYP